MGVKFLKANEAANLVKDGDLIVTGGFVGSCCPEALTKALENRFLETSSPKDLTLMYAAAQGDGNGKGADRFAHAGMTKRVLGGHWNLSPSLGKMAINNEIEAYNLPQGTLSQLFRDIAGKRIGTITHVGLNTFVDPRLQGGKLNEITKKDIVEVINIKGEERLLYKSFPIDICFLRGSFADEKGNVTLENEVASLEVTSIAQATKNTGGIVIVQVEKVVECGTLDPRLVKIPGIYVDGVVIAEPEDHEQCFGCEFESARTGKVRIPVSTVEKAPLNQRKVIARRAALELEPGTTVNLGIGIPEVISLVANEEGIGEYMTLTVEAGAIGGVPEGGTAFGACINPESILDQAYQFDFYDGGGLDLAFLGLAQTDKNGNINVSKFGPRIAGCGGFINITQNSKKVFFCGTFTAGGLKIEIKDGKLNILQEGKAKKFINQVEQITFSGEYAQKTKQPVMYITERAVFELKDDGVYLTEIAPGVDLQKDILDLMDFKPKMEGEPKLMDSRIFFDKPMGLK
ncbi:3-oxoacid CoA-transferase [Clostridium tetani]|uniref:Acetyl-coA:acetoacetyl-coA transferase alpha subunit n=1 Tax=Clostridium tetani (strain Massachusetts / E88) TaxID=212717 RepID=Q898H4_CLOTE|nr:acyl CoA:acetate/3-ketoacid CoA transferase [Clostridium tetani]AAO35107.1 acetyl-coA:acetoacetyl-coA transferase alpha subunit [Clostridium tetani E88]KGI38950.1 3-oxoacid CoA-transferase [Clostridium tetani]KGI46086.1 3-oxoacid CoA-transferase [Clostridium tetani]KHO37939.1 3-oxoacid CoA-transferase [Clostridium tetani]KIG20234.1 3-oxoacid CoA-transferase [Clostridium tetani]